MKSTPLTTTALLLLTATIWPLAGLQAQTYLIDFGGAGLTNQPSYGAVPTTSPTNGNYWNNSQGGPSGRPSDIANLISTANQTSGISLTWTNWGSGVSTASMGVTNVPTNSTLFSSPLNIATAVGDSVFTSIAGNTNRFFLSGLTPLETYNLSIFASRTGTGARSTAFTVTGANILSNIVQTTGTDLGGPGLNYSVTPWDFSIQAATNGQISIDFAIGSGGFAYINTMSVQAVPEPSTLSMLGLAAAGATALCLRRRRR